jgi:hypothetical protein
VRTEMSLKSVEAWASPGCAELSCICMTQGDEQRVLERKATRSNSKV